MLHILLTLKSRPKTFPNTFVLLFVLADLINSILTRHESLDHREGFLTDASLLLLSAAQSRLMAQVQDVDVLNHAAASHLTEHS